jgi:hypothetical protein
MRMSTLSAVAIALIIGAAALTGCGSSSQSVTESQAIVELPPAGTTVQMTVGQLGEFTSLPSDMEYIIESSAPGIVDVFEGYVDDSGIAIEGPGVVALDEGTADISVRDRNESGELIEQFSVVVSE